jgi:hypothetical protein
MVLSKKAGIVGLVAVILGALGSTEALPLFTEIFGPTTGPIVARVIGIVGGFVATLAHSIFGTGGDPKP